MRLIVIDPGLANTAVLTVDDGRAFPRASRRMALASLVMTHYAGYKQMWAAGQKGIIPGDELVTNDHERSAACHASAYINTHRYE
jgi:hypothetical protein